MKIDIQQGVMAIIGQTNGSIVCQVTGVDTYGSVVHLVNRFGKNCIQTRSVENRHEMIIFEYNLRGELRNPKKLLSSLRKKLIRAFIIVESQMHAQFADEDFAMDMAATHGRGPAYK